MIEVLIQIRDAILQISETNTFIDIILPMITTAVIIAALIFTAKATTAASKSAKAAEKTIKNNTLVTMLDERYSDKIWRAKVSIRKYYNDNEPESRFVLANFRNEIRNNINAPINLSRKHFSTYYLRLYDLRNYKMIDDKEMKLYLTWSDLDMLIRLVKPLAVEVHNSIEGHEKVDLDTLKDNMFCYFVTVQLCQEGGV